MGVRDRLRGRARVVKQRLRVAANRLELGLRWRDPGAHVDKMRETWDRLSRKSRLNFVSHLEPGAEWNPAEFARVGERFVDRMAERFSDHGALPLAEARILEIGCGVGRFARELVGVDISAEMVGEAARYCEGLANTRFEVNNGATLDGFADGSFDYAVCCGVMQHITHLDVIIGYVREALRVVAPGGLFLFQFEATRTAAVGQGTTGARVTAAALDQGLAALPYRIREISRDPVDRLSNLVIVLEVSPGATAVDRCFRTFPITERAWIAGVYDDVQTQTVMHRRQATEANRLTFYD